MRLETPRLILDTWQSSDWMAFRPIATDPEVMRFISGGTPWSDDEIRAFVDRQVQLYAERGFCRWKVRIKPGGELIGFCGVGVWRHPPFLEIGWWLARAWWGHGLASEAASAALRDALNALGWTGWFRSPCPRIRHRFASCKNSAWSSNANSNRTACAWCVTRWIGRDMKRSIRQPKRKISLRAGGFSDLARW